MLAPVMAMEMSVIRVILVDFFIEFCGLLDRLASRAIALWAIQPSRKASADKLAGALGRMDSRWFKNVGRPNLLRT